MSDAASSTSQYLDGKIQIFQSEYGSDHCFRCIPSEPYQFFSDNNQDMVKYSSNWFSGTEDSSKIDWFPENCQYLTDIGYSGQVPLFSTYKYQVEKVINTGNVNEFKFPLPKQRLIPIGECHPAAPVKIAKVKEPHARKLASFSTINTRKSKFARQISAHFKTKMITSRFGRTREVIDFSIFGEDL